MRHQVTQRFLFGTFLLSDRSKKKNFIPFRDESQQVDQRSVFKVPSIPLCASAGGKATMCCGVQTFSLRLHSGEKSFSLYRQDLWLVPVKLLRNILRHFGESS